MSNIVLKNQQLMPSNNHNSHYMYSSRTNNNDTSMASISSNSNNSQMFGGSSDVQSIRQTYQVSARSESHRSQQSKSTIESQTPTYPIQALPQSIRECDFVFENFNDLFRVSFSTRTSTPSSGSEEDEKEYLYQGEKPRSSSDNVAKHLLFLFESIAIQESKQSQKQQSRDILESEGSNIQTIAYNSQKKTGSTISSNLQNTYESNQPGNIITTAASVTTTSTLPARSLKLLDKFPISNKEHVSIGNGVSSVAVPAAVISSVVGGSSQNSNLNRNSQRNISPSVVTESAKKLPSVLGYHQERAPIKAKRQKVGSSGSRNNVKPSTSVSNQGDAKSSMSFCSENVNSSAMIPNPLGQSSQQQQQNAILGCGTKQLSNMAFITNQASTTNHHRSKRIRNISVMLTGIASSNMSVIQPLKKLSVTGNSESQVGSADASKENNNNYYSEVSHERISSMNAVHMQQLNQLQGNSFLLQQDSQQHHRSKSSANPSLVQDINLDVPQVMQQAPDFFKKSNCKKRKVVKVMSLKPPSATQVSSASSAQGQSYSQSQSSSSQSSQNYSCSTIQQSVGNNNYSISTSIATIQSEAITQASGMSSPIVGSIKELAQLQQQQQQQHPPQISAASSQSMHSQQQQSFLMPISSNVNQQQQQQQEAVKTRLSSRQMVPQLNSNLMPQSCKEMQSSSIMKLSFLAAPSTTRHFSSNLNNNNNSNNLQSNKENFSGDVLENFEQQQSQQLYQQSVLFKHSSPESIYLSNQVQRIQQNANNAPATSYMQQQHQDLTHLGTLQQKAALSRIAHENQNSVLSQQPQQQQQVLQQSAVNATHFCEPINKSIRYSSKPRNSSREISSNTGRSQQAGVVLAAAAASSFSSGQISSSSNNSQRNQGQMVMMMKNSKYNNARPIIGGVQLNPIHANIADHASDVAFNQLY